MINSTKWQGCGFSLTMVPGGEANVSVSGGDLLSLRLVLRPCRSAAKPANLARMLSQHSTAVRNVQPVPKARLYITVFTVLHGMQMQSTDENSVCLSVRLYMKRVDCDKTEERYVQIFIPYERSLHCALWLNGRKICPDFYTILKII